MNNIINANQFAAVCANMGWDRKEAIDALVEDYKLDKDAATEIVNAEQRKRDELDVADAHDEIIEEAR